MIESCTQCRWRIRNSALFLSLALIVLGQTSSGFGEPPPDIEKAIRYLAAEVPKWHRENACYSCHNNGDAVRALATAASRGHLQDPKPLDETIRFLRSPDTWDANGPDGPFKDEKLARIQFAAALGELIASGLNADRDALRRAATLVAELQQLDGSWPADAEGTIGSPVTYGQPLATAVALNTLRAADARQFSTNIERGLQWFSAREPRNVLDAAATLLALSGVESQPGRLRRTQALKLIAAGESAEGGWGPFANSPPDIFDTAIVLLALDKERANRPSESSLAAEITHGRRYLLAHQNADGSWPATTRPPGVDSYAQQVSTTGWALQALLVTAAGEPEKRASRSAAEGK